MPDNLKTGVTKASHYEPVINPVYWELAKYYGVAVIPARIRKPKDYAEFGITEKQQEWRYGTTTNILKENINARQSNK